MAPSNLSIPSPAGGARSPSPASGDDVPTQYGSPAAPTVPQIPLPASHVPTPQFGSPARGGSPALRPTLTSTPSNDNVPAQALDDLSEAQKADIVRRHLLTADEQRSVAAESAFGTNSPRNASQWALRSDFTGAAGPADSSASSAINVGGDEEYPTPYQSTAGDIVAPIYKWAAQQGTSASGAGQSSTPSLRRSKSLVSVQEAGGRRASHSAIDGGRPTGLTDPEHEELLSAREILEPGGFRRDFVIRRLASRGEEPPQGRFTRNFASFLVLYGHFGGEDLEEVDEEDEDIDEEDELDYDASTIRGYDGTTPRAGATRELTSENEQSPLLKRTAPKPSRLERQETSRSMRGTPRKRASSVGNHGDATVTQAVLMLLKSFVGTGVLFLGKAFYNGGIIFSTIVLCFIAMISLYSFLLLVETRLVVHGSFGDIGGMLFGKYMRWMILFSIVLSQVGFVAAYTIFVSENLQAFIMAVTNCAKFVPIVYLILAQLIIFLRTRVPIALAMIRNIQKLSGTALIADAFILFGLVYIFSNEIKVLADNGLADVKLFNSKDFPLLIGTAVFSFEGIGLVIPITESMADPHRFPRVLTGVMFGVMILFAGAGALAYAAYGSAIQTVVFVNLPQDDKFVNAAQFLYSIAILLSTPLQLFPAVRIMENGIFSRSGKHSNKVKWEKNLFRFAVVVGCSGVAWAGASDLDKFVSLIGSVACVPLCFCYPALLHFKACAVTRKQKVIDGALFIFGIMAAVYTTSQTVILLRSGGASAPPTFGKCPPRN